MFVTEASRNVITMNIGKPLKKKQLSFCNRAQCIPAFELFFVTPGVILKDYHFSNLVFSYIVQARFENYLHFFYSNRNWKRNAKTELFFTRFSFYIALLKKMPNRDPLKLILFTQTSTNANL